MKSMKILFFAYDVPMPLNSGGKIRAYHFIRNLAKKHEITLFTWYRQEEQRKYLNELNKYCKTIYLFKRRKPWSLTNIFLKFFTLLPFLSVTYYSDDLKKKLIEVAGQENFDVAHFESFYPALYLPLVKKLGIKTILSNENLEWQIYDRYARLRKFPFNKILLLEVWMMRRYEEWLWRQADVNIALSENDRRQIEAKTAKICPVIPNGVDVPLFKPLRHLNNRNTIIYVGTLVYQANKDAIFYFLDKIYPLIKSRLKEVKFLLLSWYKPKWLEKYLASDASISLIQDRETSVFEFLRKADLSIAPLRIVGGTNIKILEAMAAGLPVLTTQASARGLGPEFKPVLTIADEEKEFATQAVALLNDPKKRNKLGHLGRQLVERFYDWEKISEKLLTIYEQNAKET